MDAWCAELLLCIVEKQWPWGKRNSDDLNSYSERLGYDSPSFANFAITALMLVTDMKVASVSSKGCFEISLPYSLPQLTYMEID